MFRPALALLLVLPVQAQVTRVPQVIRAPTVAPAASRAFAAAPRLALPSALAAPLAAPAAPSLALAPLATVLAPAALAPAARQEPRRDLWEDPDGHALFDGARVVRSERGVLYDAIPQSDGVIRLLRRDSGPAPIKPVPGVEGLQGAALRDALAEFSAKDHKVRTYEETSDFLFSTADSVVVNGVRGVVDAYSGVFVPGTSKEGRDYPEPGDRNGDGHRDRGMNVEHVWPQSLFGRKLPMRSDLDHLLATFEHPNMVRGALPFGVVKGPTDYSNSAGAKRGADRFEPPDEVKGQVARMVLNFRLRYAAKGIMGPKSVWFFNTQVETLLEWNRRFPPNELEVARAVETHAFQGTRNPLVADYTLADRIGLDAWKLEVKHRPLPKVRNRPAFRGRPSGGRSRRPQHRRHRR